MQLSASDLPSEVDASALCLACGLCCSGALHAYTVLGADEAAPMQALGCRIGSFQGNVGFFQPCPLHQDDRCTVYDRRPRICRSYRCGVLRRYLAGDVTLNRSLNVIRVARTQLAVLEGHLPDTAGTSFAHWLKSVQEAIKTEDNPEHFTDSRLQDFELLRHTAALGVYLDKYFAT